MLKGKYKIILQNEDNEEIIEIKYLTNFEQAKTIFSDIKKSLEEYDKKRYGQCIDCNQYFEIEEMQKIDDKFYCHDCTGKKIGGLCEV